MNPSVLLSTLALVLVGGFFILNTGTSDGEKSASLGGSPTTKLKEGIGFQSGLVSSSKNKIDYTIFTYDYGVNWWAVKRTDDRWHVIGSADKVYPGLLKQLNDPVHAELALQDYQNKQKLKK